MTFDEYWDTSNNPQKLYRVLRIDARVIWNAAQVEMQERCAKVCLTLRPAADTNECAEAIRELDKA